MTLNVIKSWIRECKEGSCVLIDESMQPWISPDWKSHTLTTERAFCTEMLGKGVRVYVIHSWTKLWACKSFMICFHCRYWIEVRKFGMS